MKLRQLAGVAGGLGLATALVLLAGCAGSEQYREGQKFVLAGEYDRAAAAFRQAIAQDPQNSGYRTALAEAQALAADQHVEQAEKLLAQHRPSAAKQELQIALDQMPAHPKAILMVGPAENQIRQCEELLEQARAARQREDWADARRLTDEAARIDASHPQLQPARPAEASTRLPATSPAPIPEPPGPAPVAKRPQDPPAPQRTRPPRQVIPPPRPVPPPSPPPPPKRADPPKQQSPRQIRRHQTLRRVFLGTVSRDDDRYNKEIQTVDGIRVKVSDTDKKPLDADLEIRVGSARLKRKNQRVGARIHVRGVSGRAYQVLILAIEDKDETVHFAVETNVPDE